MCGSTTINDSNSKNISSLGGMIGKSMSQDNQTSATISIVDSGTDIVGSNNKQFNSTDSSDDRSDDENKK